MIPKYLIPFFQLAPTAFSMSDAVEWTVNRNRVNLSSPPSCPLCCVFELPAQQAFLLLDF